MPKFRKKPVVIEAMQYTGANKDAVFWWLDSYPSRPAMHITAEDKIAIETLEGVITADVNDWIICGVKHEFYPCKPDIFAATYEAVD